MDCTDKEQIRGLVKESIKKTYNESVLGTAAVAGFGYVAFRELFKKDRQSEFTEDFFEIEDRKRGNDISSEIPKLYNLINNSDIDEVVRKADYILAGLEELEGKVDSFVEEHVKQNIGTKIFNINLEEEKHKLKNDIRKFIRSIRNDVKNELNKR